jgi:uncharacterized repeat protein (TIGR01451 family)
VLSTLIAATAFAQTPAADSSAFGESVNLTLLPLLGGGVPVASGPLPQVSGNAPPVYTKTGSQPSVTVSTSQTGQILGTGAIAVNASSSFPASPQAQADATVNNLTTGLGTLLPLLTLNAQLVHSSAVISGTCGGSLIAAGAVNITAGTTGGSLGLGLSVPVNPAPNTMLLNAAGVKVILNEQQLSGNGTTTRTLMVNAIHISIQDSLLSALGTLNGDILIASSQANVQCGATAQPSADLAVTGSVSPNPVAPGGTVTYSITVINNGPDAAPAVALNNVLPSGVTAQSAVASQGSCSLGPILSCALGSLAAGQSSQVTITGHVTATQGTLVDSASVASGVNDPTPANSTMSWSTTVQAATTSADLLLTNAASAATIASGGSLTYTVTVTNRGPNSATGTVMTDPLPAGVALQSATASQGTCTASAVCSLGTLASGQAATVTITVTVTAAQGTIVNTAGVTSAVADPLASNNTASASTQVQGGGGGDSAELSILKTASPSPVTSGATLTYTLTVTNHGPSGAGGVSVSDPLPAGLSFQSASATQGSCGGGATVTCSLGTLAAGQTATVTIKVTVTATQGSIVNTGTVVSAVTDPLTTDNTSSVTTPVSSACGPPSQSAGPAACRTDASPAATLLIPYFAVDVDHPQGQTTLFSVTNAFAAPRLAHVTLWTDWAVPTLSFDLYLTGYDTETVDLRQIFAGNLPKTGSVTSPHGDISDPNVNFPGCSASAASQKPLPPWMCKHLRYEHTGLKSLVTGLCAGSKQSNLSVVAGYITIDSVRSCSTLAPGDPGYFVAGGNGVATNDNVLLGDYVYVNPGLNQADGDTAVHLRADAGTFTAGAYTFYGRYVNGDGSDNRQPLGSAYGVRYSDAAPFTGGTQVIVWRDTKSPDKAARACGGMPSWGQLGQGGLLAFDQQENSTLLAPASKPVPWATQMVTIGGAALPAAYHTGWLLLDLGHDATALFGKKAQAWVTVRHQAAGKFSAGYRAFSLNNLCPAQ